MAEPWGLRKEWWEMKRELDGFHKMAGLVFFLSTSIFWASTIYTVLGTRRLWIADLFLAFRECKFYYTIQGWLHSSKVTRESSGKRVSKMAHMIRAVFLKHYWCWHGGCTKDWRQQRWEALQEEITEGRLGGIKARERFGSYFRGQFQKYIWKNLALFYNSLNVEHEG